MLFTLNTDTSMMLINSLFSPGDDRPLLTMHIFAMIIGCFVASPYYEYFKKKFTKVTTTSKKNNLRKKKLNNIYK